MYDAVTATGMQFLFHNDAQEDEALHVLRCRRIHAGAADAFDILSLDGRPRIADAEDTAFDNVYPQIPRQGLPLLGSAMLREHMAASSVGVAMLQHHASTPTHGTISHPAATGGTKSGSKGSGGKTNGSANGGGGGGGSAVVCLSGTTTGPVMLLSSSGVTQSPAPSPPLGRYRGVFACRWGCGGGY